MLCTGTILSKVNCVCTDCCREKTAHLNRSSAQVSWDVICFLAPPCHPHLPAVFISHHNLSKNIVFRRQSSVLQRRTVKLIYETTDPVVYCYSEMAYALNCASGSWAVCLGYPDTWRGDGRCSMSLGYAAGFMPAFSRWRMRLLVSRVNWGTANKHDIQNLLGWRQGIYLRFSSYVTL